MLRRVVCLAACWTLALAADPSDDCVGFLALLGRDPPTTDADCTEVCGAGLRTGDRKPEFWTECNADGRLTSFISVPGGCDGGWSSSIPCVDPLPIDQLPAEIGLLTELERFYIRNNNLGGPIPPEIGQLTKLTLLGLGGNNFEGDLPVELSNLVNLEHFLLTPGNADLTGTVPAGLCDVLGVTELSIGLSQTSTTSSNTPQVWDGVLHCETTEYPQPDIIPCGQSTGVTLPGVIQAESFCDILEVNSDNGPVDSVTSGTSTPVVGWIKTGEAYTYQVAPSTTDATYKVSYTISGGNPDGSTDLNLYLIPGGIDCTGTGGGTLIVNGLQTGGMKSYATLEASTTFTLPKSSTLVTVCIGSGSYFNFDKVTLTATSGSPTSAPTGGDVNGSTTVFGTPLQVSYDYIVIGGGVSGSLMAARLATSDLRPSVLLLEAGEATLNKVMGTDSEFFHVPGKWGTACDFNTADDCQTDFQYDTVEQENGVPVKRIWVGKHSGGNGQENGMQYMKGSRADFERWASIGPEYSIWGPEEVWPYFQKHENASAEILAESPGAYGSAGPIVVTRPIQVDEPLPDWFLQAWNNSGMPEFPDAAGNGTELGARLGAGLSTHNIRPDGFRSDPFTMFIEPLLSLGADGTIPTAAPEPTPPVALTVLTQAFVKQIIFATDGTPVATGVIYSDANGIDQLVSLSKELVLTAGAINTPTLLMRSGVGNFTELSTIDGIPLVLDLPAVGANVTDHVGLRNSYLLNDPTSYVPEILGESEDEINAQYAEVPPAGPLMNGGPPIIGFFRSPEHMGTLNAPFVAEVQPGGYVIDDGPNIEITTWPTPSWLGGCNSNPCTGFQFPTTLIQQKSKGTVKLDQAGALNKPIIDVGYLTDPADVETLYQGFLKVRQIVSLEPLASVAFESYPADLVTDFDSFTNELFAGDLMQIINHHTSSCQMGPDGCVNEKLQVHGLGNVRIADASVMPGHGVSCNPQATIMMIAEKGAEFILQDLVAAPI